MWGQILATMAPFLLSPIIDRLTGSDAAANDNSGLTPEQVANYNKIRMELANLALQTTKNRLGIESQYMPVATEAARQFADRYVNRPRSLVWGKGVFEPKSYWKPERINLDFPAADWKIPGLEPEEPVVPVGDPVPELPPGGGTQPPGGNPGQPGPGDGVFGPANMPPGIGWVSPGKITAGPYNPEMGSLMFVNQGIGNLPHTVYDPTSGSSIFAHQGIGDPPHTVYDPTSGTSMFAHQGVGNPPHTVYDPTSGSLMADLQTRPSTDYQFSAVPTELIAQYTKDALGGHGLLNLRTGEPGQGYGTTGFHPVMTMPTLRTGEGGQGYGASGFHPAMDLPALKTGDPGQGYGATGFHPTMTLPTLRTGDPGQGYGTAGFHPSMDLPTLKTGQPGQGYEAAGFVPQLDMPTIKQGEPGSAYSATNNPSVFGQFFEMPPPLSAAIEQINMMPPQDREELISSMGGLPPGMMVGSGGTLNARAGLGQENITKINGWLLAASTTLPWRRNYSDGSSDTFAGGLTGTPTGSNASRVFSTDPAVRYGVGPDDYYDVLGRKERKRG